MSTEAKEAAPAPLGKLNLTSLLKPCPLYGTLISLFVVCMYIYSGRGLGCGFTETVIILSLIREFIQGQILD